MKLPGICLAAFSILTPAAFAQNHSTLIISATQLFRLDIGSGQLNAVTTVRWNGAAYATCMDSLNQGFVAAYNPSPMNPIQIGSVLHIDRNGGLLTSVTGLTPTLAGILPARQGGYHVLRGAFGWQTPGAYHVDLAGHVATLFQSGLAGPRNLTRDVHTGELIVLDTDCLLRVSPDWRHVSTLARVGSYSGPQITQHLATGNFYVAPSRGGEILEVTPNGTMTTLSFPAPLIQFLTVVADRSSAARPRLLAGASDYRVYEIDLTSLALRTVGTIPASTGIGFDRSRNLTSRWLGPARWEIGIHHASGVGKSYVIGISASGFRPGVGLPDGRRLPLNLDGVTQLSVAGRLAPALTGNIGTLSATGHGTAVLDVSAWPQLNGLPIWIAAVVLDPRAPIGIDLIPDPMVLVL